MTPSLRSLLVAIVALAGASVLTMGACLGDIERGETTSSITGGGGVGGVGGEGGSTTGGGEEVCLTPPDGYCDEEEDCSCTSCAPAAACTEGGCMANGYCDLAFEDSCVCSDCDDDNDCINHYGGGECTDDGSCDRAVESCACADCFDEPTCVDNQELCLGGAPDGLCQPGQESCGCNDCLGSFACLCEDDAYCDIFEPCVCLDCQTDAFCSNTDNCTNDGNCDWILEGCGCVDCAPAPICNG